MMIFSQELSKNSRIQYLKCSLKSYPSADNILQKQNFQHKYSQSPRIMNKALGVKRLIALQ